MKSIRTREWRNYVRAVFTMREELPIWLSRAFFFLAILIIAGAYTALYTLGNNNLPSWTKLLKGAGEMITDPRSGEHMAWIDTVSSLSRLIPSLAIASILGVTLGLYMGVYVAAESMWGRILNFQENIIPQAAMVVFLTVLGFDLKMYIGAIVFGALPVIAIRVYQAVREVHNEHIFSAKTLGASPQEIVWSLLFWQVLPHILNAILASVSVGLGILFLTEWVAGNSGFGYRFQRLYRSARVDVIIPYLMYLGLGGILTQQLFKKLQQVLCPWFVKEEKS